MTWWEKIEPDALVTSFHKKVYRVVEYQYRSATQFLLDDFEEANLLEEMLDEHKPEVPHDYAEEYHYLLYTPFRYPPLEYGSRFGSREETGLWYGSLKKETALCEKAFYLQLFLKDSQGELGSLMGRVTVFKAAVKTSKCIDLTIGASQEFTSHLSSPHQNYQETQKLGAQLRRNYAMALYYSARTKKREKNCVVFTPQVFSPQTIYSKDIENWDSFATKKEVVFSRLNKKIHFYS